MKLYRSAPAWLAAVSILIGFAVALPSPSRSQDETFGLPEGKGREEVMAYCAACHSLRLVSQQRLARYRWEELLELMNQKHGMPKLPPEDEEIVLNYLGKQLAPAPRRRRF